MVTNRTYTSRRSGITKALADKLAEIDGRGLFRSSVAETSARLKFWDEVEEFSENNPFGMPYVSNKPLATREWLSLYGEDDIGVCDVFQTPCDMWFSLSTCGFLKTVSP